MDKVLGQESGVLEYTSALTKLSKVQVPQTLDVQVLEFLRVVANLQAVGPWTKECSSPFKSQPKWVE